MYRDDPEIAKKYRSKRWQKLRILKKAQNPVCERCLKNGKVTPTYIIHHKEYITDKNYMDDDVFFNRPFYDEFPLQKICIWANRVRQENILLKQPGSLT